MNVCHEQHSRGDICPCCGQRARKTHCGIFSPFLAKRALNSPPLPVQIHACGQCGCRWSRRGLSQEEAQRLYAGYRGEAYFAERHAFEPWYSREFNDGIGAEARMAVRRGVLMQLLARVRDREPIGRALDYGGDRGQMLAELGGAEKFVYEISGVEPDPGVCALHDLDGMDGRFDLVLNCHVLEHVNSPSMTLEQVVRLARPGGLVFLEVPDEAYTGPPTFGFEAGYLQRLCRSPRLVMLMDFLSTASRIKLRWLFPLGFVAVREHINYFTLAALRSLMIRCGLQVLESRTAGASHVALGRKP